MAEYKHCSYSLCKVIKQAKCQYIDKVKSQFNGSDTRRMLQAITDYKNKISHVTDTDVLLPDELNTLFAHFEDNTATQTQAATKDCGLSFSVADVSKTFKCVNPRKTAGQDDIPSRVLRACVDQLPDVFTDIFNLSLSQTSCLVCLQTYSISPCPRSAAWCVYRHIQSLPILPKKAKVTELIDYRPVALTSVIRKCF